MKLPYLYAVLVEKVLMALVMSLVISWVMLAIEIGFRENFFHEWISSWGLAFLVALPTSLILGPLIKKVVFSFAITADVKRKAVER